MWGFEITTHLMSAIGLFHTLAWGRKVVLVLPSGNQEITHVQTCTSMCCIKKCYTCKYERNRQCKWAAVWTLYLATTNSQRSPPHIATSSDIRYMSSTSYLNFAAEIRGLPSRNSVNAREIFRRASAPALQTGRRNIPAAEHFSRNMVVSRRRRDRFHPAGESGLATQD